MEKVRKPKGSEGGNLQIRDLDADTLQKLQELKDYFSVGTSSKAALLAIKQFMTYKEENQSLRAQLADAKKEIFVAKKIIETKNDLFNELSDDLKTALNKVKSR
jgi:hypothetical protein